MPLKLVTPPAEEPVSLEEAKSHLRLEGVDDDAYVAVLIAAARRRCEAYQSRAYITQTWDLYLDGFPAGDIRIPIAPLESVVSVKYKDTAGSMQTLDPSCYVVDTASEPGRISPACGQSWPSTYGEINAVEIRFVAGYGAAADVPEHIRQAILMTVGDLYEHRGGEEGVDRDIERAVEALLWPDRIVPV